jgi:hypothetical protein
MTRNPDYVLSLLQKGNAPRETRQTQSTLDELCDVLGSSD